MAEQGIQGNEWGSGLASIESRHSVDETVTRIEEILRAKQVKLFALIDHSGEAAAAGLSMPPTKVVIFGNPKGGTPLMLAAPTTAIDLPLKLLVAEDAQGVVRITWNTPEYLLQRHGFPNELMANIAVIAGIAKAAAE
ncbi:DUF302 domain-containing protein [Silvibacterium dinghuense]|uniref:DUF302 domain-containing protein n=1 Tax=Silvibacterium dinghuense TaxID=1560006 RepID=A0A4Q1SKP7_9BACT|nr:DUF302 domain-containing protein [Silvibacterium dinghuense]RXS97880.1 DUF302 domain-containing protein [Silvibacterium dinghuense]GGH02706.1 hypothetical protein GCM10011586_18180 [Silvibacterium dinghuense]